MIAMKIGYLPAAYLVSVGTTTSFLRGIWAHCYSSVLTLNPLIFTYQPPEAIDLCHQGLGVTLPFCKT
jgi:hypothetical protein